MKNVEKEPNIRVGVVTGASEIRGELSGAFRDESGAAISGTFTANFENGMLRLNGGPPRSSLRLSPDDFENARVTLHDVTIGIDFHWERRESQQFQGALSLAASTDGITAINELPLENYLISVISSEMSAANPPDLLRAHATISRSWLLAQLIGKARESGAPQSTALETEGEIIRWFDRENHADFDVCADDHCQRYQGISKAFSPEAFAAVRETRGVVLVYGEEICDARYSKSCGGMTEVYSAAWEDREVPYLHAVYDGPAELDPDRLPLDEEAKAKAWILDSPEAFCNTTDRELLGRILPNFDQETSDFYRWRVAYEQDELREIVSARLGDDIGRIRALTPLARGKSGRITRLRIEGEKRGVVIGKELMIRRVLSRSHLYSSAFVVETAGSGEFPERFTLIGAGWGHGVGLCQIGAAVMASRGYGYEAILKHYFRGADLRAVYV